MSASQQGQLPTALGAMLSNSPGALLAGVLLLSVAGCSRSNAPTTGVVRIEITHQLGAAALGLANEADPLKGTAPTAAGEAFTVSKLRYYLSNFRLRRDDGSWFVAATDADSSLGYQLVDAADPKSQRFEIDRVPAAQYSGIEFMLGIDDARNHAGAQKGALDPTRGLFWTWKTGYIFLMFEGHSPQSTAPDYGLTYHVGGGAAATRTVFLPLAPKPARVEMKLVPTIHLKADVGQLFDTPHVVHFSTLSSAMGAEQTRPIADNAAAMFTVDHLHHEPLAAR